MEEDKKRNKRNKKKKNKQTAKPTHSAALAATESTSDNQSNVLPRGEENNHQISGTSDVLDDVGGHTDAVKDGTLANYFEGKNSAKAEKHCRLDRETSFIEKIKELQAEKDAHTQKEAFLEERIRQLLEEKDEISQKEANQKDKIRKLQDEKYATMKNEASLKEKLMQLEKEKTALIQTVDYLEQRSQHLLQEMDAYLQQEVNLQEKIKQMERERDSWILKENSAKESIVNLINDKAKLQDQVIELEQAREALFEEKRELKEIISGLKLQITDLESTGGLPHSSMVSKVTSEKEMNYKIEATQVLVEKLVAENSELVVKVNELCAELDQRELRRTEHFSSAGSVHGVLSAPPGDESTFIPEAAVGAGAIHTTDQATDTISEASKMMPIPGSNQSLEDVMIEDARNGEQVNLTEGYGVGITSSEMEGDEIVQIPLDENEVVKETNLELVQNDENTDVPLTDAPLIGAPFRLISFVARYVSGADLVNKNAGSSS